MDQETSGSTPLFAVFLLSIVSLVLVPYTLHSLFGGDDDDKEVVKTWSSKKDKRRGGALDAFSARLRSTFTPKMMVAWGLYLLLLLYVKSASAPMERFDPFEILQISDTATDADIKRAYRKLSLQYHPDKNPDPQATAYFAEYITKAYKALTDDVSRENYKKYGHPDGPQAVSISVALPEWFFNKDKEAAPAILLTLLIGGIVLPLGLAACYLGRSQKVTGPDEVAMETTQGYIFAPFGVKQYQGVGRLLETLVCALEFIPPQLPLTADQGPALQTLSRDLALHYPEIKDKNGAFFKKRHPGVVKAHMLLMAHMARVPVPAALSKDLEYVLRRAPRLVQEMFNVAALGRVNNVYGWLAPAVGCVELLQCLVSGVSIEEKKRAGGVPGKMGEGPAALLQLPHVDDDLVRRLFKLKKIKNLSELAALAPAERRAALQSCGLSATEADDVEVAMSALPTLTLTAEVFPSDPDGPVDANGDAYGLQTAMTLQARVLLQRPSHRAPGFDPDSIKGKATAAYAPHFPFPREEHWFFILGAPGYDGAMLAWTRVALVEAEAEGARHAGSWMSADDAVTPEEAAGVRGQKVEFQFLAPPAGKHDLVLYAMPDSWIGTDRVVAIKLRTAEMSRAEREGRAAAAAAGGAGPRRKAAAARGDGLDRSEESELQMGGGSGEEDGEGEDWEGDGAEEEEEEDSEDEGEREYDSDEYGTEESADEADSDAEE